jgi:hypothetical protein
MTNPSATISTCYSYYLSLYKGIDSPENSVEHDISSFPVINKYFYENENPDPNSFLKCPKFIHFYMDIQKKEKKYIKAIDAIRFNFENENSIKFQFNQTYNSIIEITSSLKEKIRSYELEYPKDPMQFLNISINTRLLKSLENIIQHIITHHHQYLLNGRRNKTSTLSEPFPVYHTNSKVNFRPESQLEKFKSFPLKDFEKKLESLTLAYRMFIDFHCIQANKNSELELHTFINVFSGKEIYESVIWCGELQYLSLFIKCLTSKKNNICYIYKGKWDIALNCFVKPDHSKFKYYQLAQAEGSPKHPELIFEIIKLLL